MAGFPLCKLPMSDASLGPWPSSFCTGSFALASKPPERLFLFPLSFLLTAIPASSLLSRGTETKEFCGAWPPPRTHVLTMGSRPSSLHLAAHPPAWAKYPSPPILRPLMNFSALSRSLAPSLSQLQGSLFWLGVRD